MGYGDDVRSRSPGGLHGQADGRAARGDVNDMDFVNAIADDRQRRLALETRVEAQLHRLARAVARLVETHIEKVRRIRRLVARPSDREGQAGLPGLAEIGRAHIEPVGAPLHRSRNACGPVGCDSNAAVRHPARGLDRLVAPAPIGIVPLIALLDLVQVPGDIAAGETPARGIGKNHIEGRIRARAKLLTEGLAHGHNRALGQDRQRQAALHCSSARLGHAQGDAGLRRPWRYHLLHSDLQADASLRIGGGIWFDLGGRSLYRLVIEADDVAFQSLDAAGRGRRHRNLAGDGKIAPRCAVEIARSQVDGGWLSGPQGVHLRGKGQFQALGHIILDQEAGLSDGGNLGIGIRGHAPGAPQRARQDRERQSPAAESLVQHQVAAILNTVRTPHHNRQRQSPHRRSFAVPQQRRQRHRLAGAIDTALSVEIGIHGARDGPSFHAPIRQIEGRAPEIQKTVIDTLRRHDKSGSQPPFAAGEAGIEGGRTQGIGLLRRQHLVVAGNQPDLHIALGLGAGKRADEDLHAAPAGESREAEIGHHEPLRGDVVPVVGAFIVDGRAIMGLCRHDINTRLELPDRLHDGESRDHVPIDVGCGIKRAVPDLDPLVASDLGCGRAGQLTEEVVGTHSGKQVAVADAIDLDIDLGRVDGDDRKALLPRARQNVIAAGEARLGRAVADIDLVISGFQQALANGRRQALPQHHCVAFAMLEPIDAKLLPFSRHGGTGIA